MKKLECPQCKNGDVRCYVFGKDVGKTRRYDVYTFHCPRCSYSDKDLKSVEFNDSKEKTTHCPWCGKPNHCHQNTPNNLVTA